MGDEFAGEFSSSLVSRVRFEPFESDTILSLGASLAGCKGGISSNGIEDLSDSLVGDTALCGATLTSSPLKDSPLIRIWSRCLLHNVPF